MIYPEKVTQTLTFPFLIEPDKSFALIDTLLNRLLSLRLLFSRSTYPVVPPSARQAHWQSPDSPKFRINRCLTR
jgi:hypothetical protein